VPKAPRILLITTQGIGNTVLALPIFETFAAAGCSLDLVLSNNGSAELARALGLGDHIHQWDEARSSLANLFSLRSALKEARFDAAYALAPAGRRENLLLRMARAEVKRGWRTPWPWRLLSFQDPRMPYWDDTKHDLRSNQLLTEVKDEQLLGALAAVRERLRSAASPPLQGATGIRMGVQPFSKFREKCWPMATMRDFLNQLHARFPLSITLFGSAAEEAELRSLAAALSAKTEVRAGAALRSVIGAVAAQQIFLGIDSSMAHLAALTGIPTCILFGATPPERVGALGENVTIVQSPRPIGSIYRFTTGFPPDHRGGLDLDPQRVLAIMGSILSRLDGGAGKPGFEAEGAGRMEKRLDFGAALLRP
jgi:ADP-heptose:LPS heptosyltransferase